jgi:membrane protein
MTKSLRWLALMLSRGSGDRGRHADSPLAIPPLGWRDIFIRVWRGSKADNLNVLAAGIAFYAFLALLPLIASTAMIYGLVSTPLEVVRHVGKLVSVIPDAAQAVVARRVIEVITGQSGGALTLLLALLLTIYGGARSARSITAALNVIYGEGDVQRFARRWGIPILLALGSAALMLFALTAIALFGYVGELMPAGAPLEWRGAKLGFWLMVGAGISGGSALLYRYVPSRRHARWAWILPGALAASILWLLATFAFGLYIARFGRYDISYGSLAAVVVLQLWIYFSAFILLLGAKLNAEIERQTEEDTTVGAPRPAGRRHAASADETGEIPTLDIDTTE